MWSSLSRGCVVSNRVWLPNQSCSWSDIQPGKMEIFCPRSRFMYTTKHLSKGNRHRLSTITLTYGPDIKNRQWASKETTSTHGQMSLKHYPVCLLLNKLYPQQEKKKTHRNCVKGKLSWYCSYRDGKPTDHKQLPECCNLSVKLCVWGLAGQVIYNQRSTTVDNTTQPINRTIPCRTVIFNITTIVSHQHQTLHLSVTVSDSGDKTLSRKMLFYNTNSG